LSQLPQLLFESYWINFRTSLHTRDQKGAALIWNRLFLAKCFEQQTQQQKRV